MLRTIAIVLLILWLLGFATRTVGALIHIVLVVAIVLFIIDLLSGRRAV